MPDTPGRTPRPERTALEDHRAGALSPPPSRALFAAGPGRAQRYAVRVGDPHIDSFDLGGVELGKVLAERVEPALTAGADVPGLGSSTAALVATYRVLRDAQGVN